MFFCHILNKFTGSKTEKEYITFIETFKREQLTPCFPNLQFNYYFLIYIKYTQTSWIISKNICISYVSVCEPKFNKTLLSHGTVLQENIDQHFVHLSAYCSKHLKLLTLTDSCQKLITQILEKKKKK